MSDSTKKAIQLIGDILGNVLIDNAHHLVGGVDIMHERVRRLDGRSL